VLVGRQRGAVTGRGSEPPLSLWLQSLDYSPAADFKATAERVTKDGDLRVHEISVSRRGQEPARLQAGRSLGTPYLNRIYSAKQMRSDRVLFWT